MKLESPLDTLVIYSLAFATLIYLIREELRKAGIVKLKFWSTTTLNVQAVGFMPWHIVMTATAAWILALVVVMFEAGLSKEYATLCYRCAWIMNGIAAFLAGARLCLMAKYTQ